MNNVASGNKEKAKIFQTVLSSPGMNERCKFTLTMSRVNILMLSRLIEAGLVSDKSPFQDEVLAALPEDALAEFKSIHQEILKKAELTEFYERLKSL
jgi:hypothetical protein